MAETWHVNLGRLYDLSDLYDLSTLYDLSGLYNISGLYDIIGLYELWGLYDLPSERAFSTLLYQPGKMKFALTLNLNI